MSSRRRFPEPGESGGLAALLRARRSVREYGAGAPTIPELGRLFWAGQGISHSSGKRTVPSPHALYPLNLYLVVGETGDLEAGLYAYEPRAHVLDMLGHGDLRGELYRAALENQTWIRDCPMLIVIAGDVAATVSEFSDQPPDGQRGKRYICMEAAAAAQNIALQAAELGLGTVLVGGFDDERVKQGLGIECDPLIMLPLGRSLE